MTGAGRVRDPWAVLGLAPGASGAAIRQAWRTQAARHHPDTGGDPATFAALAAARDQLLGAGGRRGPAPDSHGAGRVAKALRPLRRRIDRRRRPRVT